MLILFFDTYIVSGSGSSGGINNSNVIAQAIESYRNNFHSYRWQEKIDVVKYTLISYSKIDWDEVIIRFECEDDTLASEFSLFCSIIFPSAKIFNKRSATALEYFEALSAIEAPDTAWVFFSPNNDHPYIAEPKEIIKFISIADKLSENYPTHNISIYYSHFTESMNDNKITDPQWGYYQNIFKSIVYEDADVIISTSNKFSNDSIKIFMLGYLKKIFFNTKNLGRVIRIEDTEFYINRDSNSFAISPKIELCRHYDSYTHIIKKVPPLFIPDGFFEGDIKIRYGYENGLNGWVNINPQKKSIDSNTDLMILLDDIPHFWRDRISHIDVNPNFDPRLNKEDLAYYRALINPWHQRLKVFNISRSIFVWLSYFGGKYFIPRLKGIGLYGLARSLKRSILKKRV